LLSPTWTQVDKQFMTVKSVISLLMARCPPSLFLPRKITPMPATPPPFTEMFCMLSAEQPATSHLKQA
jgi:hypothetical protein